MTRLQLLEDMRTANKLGEVTPQVALHWLLTLLINDEVQAKTAMEQYKRDLHK